MPWPTRVFPPIEPPPVALSEDQVLEKREREGNHSHVNTNNRNTSQCRKQTPLLRVLNGNLPAAGSAALHLPGSYKCYNKVSVYTTTSLTIIQCTQEL